MPLLRQASSVAIVQITGEKDLSKAADPAEAVRNLKLHGIAAEVVAVELEERDAATTLQAYCERDGRELLVMGAFGHSRAREFVLGGVTGSVLDAPDRKSVGSGKSVSVRVDIGGRGNFKQKKIKTISK